MKIEIITFEDPGITVSCRHACFNGVERRADCACQLGMVGDEQFPSKHLFGHYDEKRIVGDDPPRHDDVFRQGLHLQNPLDDGKKKTLDDVRNFFPLSDFFQYLRSRKDGAETSQFDQIPGLPGQAVHLFEGDIKAGRHLFEKGPRPGGAFSIHFKTGATPLAVKLDNFIVLASDVDNAYFEREIVKTPLAVATDFCLFSCCEGNVFSSVSG